MTTIQLFRPVGLKELELVMQSGWKRFPPRLDWQPIFYPVLNEPYAARIAKEWNTNDPFSGNCGVVTTFNVDGIYCSQFTSQNVGGDGYDELWVPAGKLQEFNDHIVGTIDIINAFFGDGFKWPDSEELVTKLKRFR